jgi:hypothetical protein
MTERALSFGSAAAAYERFRPGYPDELVDEVLAYVVRPVRTAASLHWITPDERWPRVAAMLTHNGVFASFGGPMHLAEPDLENAVRPPDLNSSSAMTFRPGWDTDR